MKTAIFILLSITISFFLSSCSNVLAIATPTLTSTTTFTPAPTNTPTVTPSPTETPDPNMPLDAMGKDITGYWKDVTENGKIVRYHWFELDFGIKGWFASHIVDGDLNGGIPLYDTQWNNTKIIPFHFLVQEGLQIPYIRHPSGQSDFFAPGVSTTLFTEIVNWRIGRKEWKKKTSDEQIQIGSDFRGGKLSFPFTTPAGNYSWRPSQKIGYDFFAIRWDDADPNMHPEFYLTTAGKYKYRWTIYSDSVGNLVVISAMQIKEMNDAESSLDDFEFMWWLLSPMEEMLVIRELPAKIKYWDTHFWSGHLERIALESKCMQVTVRSDPPETHNVCVTPYFEIIR